MHQKISLKDFKEQVSRASLDELKYLLTCYCGPHKVLLREKVFGYQDSKQVTYIIAMAIAKYEMDNLLSGDSQ